MSARLIEAHRKRQSMLVDDTLATIERLWVDLFDPKALTPSWDRLEPLLVGLVQQRHRVSAALASEFVATFRRSVGVTGRYVPTVAPLLVADDIVPWLRAAGPSTAIELYNTGRTAEVAAATLDSVGGSVTRMVLRGDRDTVTANITRDPKCIGYQRAASGACCAFCAMLTGKVYRSAESAGEGADWHLKCSCSAVPVYSRDQEPPNNTARYGDLWNEATRGLKGNEARIAFRQAIEGRIPE